MIGADRIQLKEPGQNPTRAVVVAVQLSSVGDHGLELSLVHGLLRSTSIPGRLFLDGQHSIAIPLRGEARVLQSFRYFVGNVPAAGQFVRGAGVVE